MPAQTKLTGGTDLKGLAPSLTELLVDVFRQAGRVSIQPWDYTEGNRVLGFYKVAQASGATLNLGAAAHMASTRWTDPSALFVPIKIRAGWTITGAVTAATPMDLQLVIARGFTVDFTTNSTAANLSAVSNTNKLHNRMGASLMGINGPRIATTAAMSGQTLTADANPIAMCPFANQPSGNATVTQAIGVGHPMQELYKLEPQGAHPIVLTNNEGLLVQPVTAGPTSGSVKYYVEWEWAELAGF